VLIFLCSCQEDISNQKQLLLNWQFSYNDQIYNARVPGNNVSDLLQNKLIQDPYIGTNEDSILWVYDQNWNYFCSFDVSKKVQKNSNKELVLNGLDTYANVYLNDSLVLQTDNMFRQWKVDVSTILKPSNNTLHIKFLTVDSIEGAKSTSLGYDLPGGNRVHSRKAGFHYGWDWGATITPSGIWKEVEIQSWNDIKTTDFYVEQTFLSDSMAELIARVEFDVATSGEYQLELNEQVFTYYLESGLQIVQLPYEILHPTRWNPRGYGEQKLYPFSLSITKDGQFIEQKKQSVGLRNIELITDKKSDGETFYFKVNDRPIFMKGANYIPQDHLQNQVSDADYRNLLNDVVLSNMNMLRVWGGGIYEQDLFYELCDSLGIMVWQDFMFACAMYPGDSLFLHTAQEEALDNVLRLRQHPSIALWCGNNENAEGWQRWGWKDLFTDSQQIEIEAGYHQLFKNILPTIVGDLTRLPYWESSPKFGRGNPKHQFEGDAHYWGVWHDAEPFSNLEKKVPRFMSEFGFQSLPEMSTIQKFADKEDLFLASEVMRSHQKHARGNSLIMEYMARDYPIPTTFDKLVYASQVLQAEGMRIGLEAHRRSQPYCMGTLYWQLNDCWPVASWSSRDYYGNWKALHYVVQDVFAPIALSIHSLENAEIQITAMSQMLNSITDTLEILVYDLNGKLKSTYSQKVVVEANTSTVLTSGFSNFDSNQLVVANLKSNAISSKIWTSFSFTEVNLLEPIIQYKWEGAELTLYTDIPAFQVYLHGLGGRFSDNYFTLLPNQEKKVSFSGDTLNKNKLLIWSLYNIYPNEK
jgi:beta-mannosidase